MEFRLRRANPIGVEMGIFQQLLPLEAEELWGLTRVAERNWLKIRPQLDRIPEPGRGEGNLIN